MKYTIRARTPSFERIHLGDVLCSPQVMLKWLVIHVYAGRLKLNHPNAGRALVTKDAVLPYLS